MGWMGLSHLGSAICGLLNTMLLTRHLGGAQYGVFLLAVAYGSCFAPLCDMGTKSIALKNVGMFPERAGEQAGSLLVLNTVLALLMTALAIGGLLAMDLTPMARGVMALMCMDLLLSRLICMESILAGLQKFRFLASVRFASSVMLLTVNTIVLAWGGRLWTLAVVSLLSNLALGLVMWWKGCSLFSLRWRGHFHRAFMMLREGWPLGLASLLSVLYLKLDLFLLAKWVSDESLAQYGVAAKCMALVVSFAAVAVEVLFPTLAAVYGKGERRLFVAHLALSILVLLGLSLLVLLLVDQIKEDWMLGVFGQGFGEVLVPLSIMSWTVFPLLFVALIKSVLTLFQASTWVLVWTVFGLALNLVLNWMWIPLYGIRGAAWATWCSDMAVMGMACLSLAVLMRGDKSLKVS